MSGMAGVKSGRTDAFAGTFLTIQEIASKDKEVEQAMPFKEPAINGKSAKGYGAFGFRKEDKDLLKEFNSHLKVFIGTEEHLKTIIPYGFTREQFPGDITTKTLCNA